MCLKKNHSSKLQFSVMLQPGGDTSAKLCGEGVEVWAPGTWGAPVRSWHWLPWSSGISRIWNYCSNSVNNWLITMAVTDTGSFTAVLLLDSRRACSWSITTFFLNTEDGIEQLVWCQVMRFCSTGTHGLRFWVATLRIFANTRSHLLLSKSFAPASCFVLSFALSTFATRIELGLCTGIFSSLPLPCCLRSKGDMTYATALACEW